MIKENNNNVEYLITDATCSGCAACMNICPVNAIKMAPNEESFMMPRIDFDLCVNCGKCARVCPELNQAESANYANPPCYAFRADDETRRKSSSGGLFSTIAKIFIDKGGWVCGAVFDENWKVKHILSNNWKDVMKMRKSKYVQSSIGYIYKDIKKILDAGDQVFFTGAPCQVAGLRSFLKKPYENLLCADVVCHGAPSQWLFDKHLSELADGQKIVDIDFRDRRYGWNSSHLMVEFPNGKIYVGNRFTDAYEKGFHDNLILRKSCYNCKFCSFPRTGDLSVGDFWGYEEFFPKNIDHNGTSMIFINNSQGEKILNEIGDNVRFLSRSSGDNQKIKNRLWPSMHIHPGRARFFKNIKNRSFEAAARNAFDEYYDIGCVGMPSTSSFGGSLSYFALYHTLEDMGYLTLLIDPPQSAIFKTSPLRQLYGKNPLPDYALSRPYKNKEDMRILNRLCKKFVTGSDQLFNFFSYDRIDRVVSLDWVDDDKKKIAIAASFAHNDVEYIPKNEIKEMRYFLNKFDHFSAREDWGVDICRDVFNMEAAHILDPVFLCDKKHYYELVADIETSLPVTPYSLSYFINISNDQKEVLAELRDMFPPFVEISELNKSESNFAKSLHAFINSEFIFTDSYHGLCFSLIFRKNFLIFANRARGIGRYISLLRSLGLEDRLIRNYNDFLAKRDKITEPIPYDIVDKILETKIHNDKAWIQRALSDDTNKDVSDRDILLNEMRKMYNDLQKKLNEKDDEIQILKKMIMDMRK